MYLTGSAFKNLVNSSAMACLFDSVSDWDFHRSQRLLNDVGPTNLSRLPSANFISFWTAEVMNFTAEFHCSADGTSLSSSADICTYFCIKKTNNKTWQQTGFHTEGGEPWDFPPPQPSFPLQHHWYLQYINMVFPSLEVLSSYPKQKLMSTTS